MCIILAFSFWSNAKTLIHMSMHRFGTLCGQQEFLSLPADKLVEIISDDDLNVAAEETVYEACMEWVNFDLPSRLKNVAEIMKCVRFANISSYYFCDKIDHNQVKGFLNNFFFVYLPYRFEMRAWTGNKECSIWNMSVWFHNLKNINYWVTKDLKVVMLSHIWKLYMLFCYIEYFPIERTVNLGIIKGTPLTLCFTC